MARKTIKGRCPLCQLDDQDIIDSHIISDFFFDPLKAKEGRFYVMSTDPSKGVRPIQKGITEHLLCKQCDGVVLSRYEKHMKEFLFSGTPNFVKDDGQVLYIKGHNYKMLKNGLLSLLWRMSLSSHPFFHEVKLGEYYENRLRDILLNDLEVQPEEFAITCGAAFLDGKFFSDFILQPDFVDSLNGRMYRCLISGIIFTFLVGHSTIDPELKSVILTPDNCLILKADVRKQIPYLNDTLKDRKKRGHAVLFSFLNE
ncbi:MAG TPA: hypothetical protein VKC60_11380 [Opitutaceae bacterium]|nr:hypothetical protein [Opitutaceae bacterium]